MSLSYQATVKHVPCKRKGDCDEAYDWYRERHDHVDGRAWHSVPVPGAERGDRGCLAFVVHPVAPHQHGAGGSIATDSRRRARLLVHAHVNGSQQVRRRRNRILRRPCSADRLFFFGLPEGFYVDLWSSYGLDNADPSSNFGDELDYTVGWNGTLSDFGLASDVRVGASASYYDLAGDGGDIGTFEKDIIALAVTAEHSFETSLGTLTPYGEAEYDFAVDWSGLEPGGKLTGGLRHSVPLSDRWTFTQDASVLYDSGALGFDSGFVGEYSPEISYQLWGNGTAYLEGTVSTPLNSMSDGRETEFVFGAGISISF